MLKLYNELYQKICSIKNRQLEMNKEVIDSLESLKKEIDDAAKETAVQSFGSPSDLSCLKKPKDAFYLEISPRQCGKTTRLLQAAHNWLSVDEKHMSFIFCAKTENGKYLREMYIKMNGPETGLSDSRSGRIRFYSFKSMAETMKDWGQNVKIFFDEFDWFDEKEFGSVPLSFYLNNGYKMYSCTTPSKLRTLAEINNPESNDLLVQLLQKNKFNFVFHDAPLHSIEWKNSLTLEEYEIEEKGKFIKLPY